MNILIFVLVGSFLGASGFMLNRFSLPMRISSFPRLASIADKEESIKKFASYVVYKGKGAVSIKVIPPTWAPAPSGKASIISREGGIYFEFAPATKPREYDWSKKLTFLMDATECGELLAKVNEGVEFMHDPNALTADAGKIVKKMKWTVSPDNKGFFASLQVSEKQGGSATTTSSSVSTSRSNLGAISIPVTFGEFTVLECIIRDSVPKILGFNRVWDQKYELFENGPAPPPPPEYLDLLE